MYFLISYNWGVIKFMRFFLDINKEKRFKQALNDVSNGLSFSEAAIKNSVPRSSLLIRAKKFNITSNASKTVILSRAKREDAIVLRKQGLSFSKIGQKLNISPMTAKKHCGHIILKQKEYNQNLYRFPEKRIQAVNYRNQGMSILEIAKILNCSKSTISIWLKQEDGVLITSEERKNNIDEKILKEKKTLINSVVEYRFNGYSYSYIAEIFNKKIDYIISVDKLYNYSEEDLIKIKEAVNKRLAYLREQGLVKPVGGFREGAERSKSGYYKGIYSSSTYELCWIIYNLDLGREVKRFDGYLKCEKDNFKYYPDFIEDGNHIIEIKGYEDKFVSRKTALAERLGYKVSLLKKEDLKDVFEYVDKKYNVKEDSRHTLYDNYKPILLLNCSCCNKEYEVFKSKKKHKNGWKNYCSKKCFLSRKK